MTQPLPNRNPFQQKWSLRVRFLLIAGVCLLPLLGVTFYVLTQSLEHSRAQLLDAEVATAEVVAQMLKTTLDDNGRMLAELANSAGVQSLVRSTASEQLDQFKRARPSVYGLFLFDDQRAMVAFAGLDPAAFSQSVSFNTALDQVLLGEALGVSDRVLTPDGPLIAVVAPVWAREQKDGQPIGVVGALMSADRVKDTVLPFARGDTAIAIFAQRELIAAQAPGSDEAMLASQLAQPIESAMAGVVGTYSFTDNEGHERLAAFAPVPVIGANWSVVVTQPSPLTYAPNRLLLARGLAALVLAAAATLVLTLAFGEWVARPLRRLTASAAAIARGDFSTRVEPHGGSEITDLGIAFNEMADRLQRQMHDLELARQAGAAHAEQLRELNRRTVRLQEDERRRIASDIHDAVAPLITGALYQTRALGLTATETRAQDGAVESAAADLDDIANLLTRSMEELHAVVFELRPPDLDDIGVVAAIERYMTQLQRTGLKCRIEEEGDLVALTPEVRLAVYRIVQEALHNALRHGAADEAVVQITMTEGSLRVIIRDNGAGFDPDAVSRPSALGLLSMRERAAAIGATFTVSSRPGDGTTVAIERKMEAKPIVDTTTIGVLIDDVPSPAPPALQVAPA